MIKAVFFDLDETLVDASICHEQASKMAFEHFDIDYDELQKRTESEDFMGMIVRDILIKMRDSMGLTDESLPIEKLSSVREKYFLQLVSEKATLLPGGEESVKAADDVVSVLAIVSSGTRKYIQTAIQKFQFEPYIDFIVGAEDVQRGKPFPDCYQKAYEIANQSSSIQKEECLVIEDSVHGISAARAAGLAVCYIPFYIPTEKPKADYEIKSLEQFPKLLKTIDSSY